MVKQCAKKCSEEGLVCNPASGRCVDPNGAIGRALKSKATKSKGKVAAPPAEAAREIKKTLKSIREFNELYAEEHAGLEHNIKNGHKRGVLSRLFHSAKNSITGLLTLIRKYPKYAALLIAVLVYGAAAVRLGKLPGIDTTSLGWVNKEVRKEIGPRNKTYMDTMRLFVEQLAQFPMTVGKSIGMKWSALITAIVTGWGKLSGVVSGLLGISPAPLQTSPVYQPLMLHQVQSLQSDTPKGYYPLGHKESYWHSVLEQSPAIYPAIPVLKKEAWWSRMRGKTSATPMTSI